MTHDQQSYLHDTWQRTMFFMHHPWFTITTCDFHIIFQVNFSKSTFSSQVFQVIFSKSTFPSQLFQVNFTAVMERIHFVLVWFYAWFILQSMVVLWLKYLVLIMKKWILSIKVHFQRTIRLRFDHLQKRSNLA